MVQLASQFAPTGLQLDKCTPDANGPYMQIDQKCRWTNRPKSRHRGPFVKGGAPATRPVGVLDIRRPRRGAAALNHRQILSILPILSISTLHHPPRVVHHPGAKPHPGLQFGSTWPNLAVLCSKFVHLVQLVSYLLLTSAILGPNLGYLNANLAQVGPILAQLGSKLVEFWSQNLTMLSFKRSFLACPSDLQFSIHF